MDNSGHVPRAYTQDTLNAHHDLSTTTTTTKLTLTAQMRGSMGKEGVNVEFRVKLGLSRRVRIRMCVFPKVLGSFMLLGHTKSKHSLQVDPY